jgi:hypothetical protein
VNFAVAHRAAEHEQVVNAAAENTVLDVPVTELCRTKPRWMCNFLPRFLVFTSG